MIFVFSLFTQASVVSSHAYIASPAARNLAGCGGSANWNIQNTCLNHQAVAGQFGFRSSVNICKQGQFGNGPEADKLNPGNAMASWKAGETVEIVLNLVLNHGGTYWYRLCLDGSDTEGCFQQQYLKFDDGSSERKLPETGLNRPYGVVKDHIVIPDGVSCDRCTLNWLWKPTSEKTTFINCADVQIGSSVPAPPPYYPVSGHTLSANYLCVDVPGGNLYNSAAVWMWECNGQQQQYWNFDDWQIQSSANGGFCVDAGEGYGNHLQIWECNGHDNQRFGWDSSSMTIYLASSKSDASQCAQPLGQSSGSVVALQECDNTEFSQKWGFGV